MSDPRRDGTWRGTWRGAPPEPAPAAGPAGWLRAGLRGGVLFAMIAAGLALTLILRLPERLFSGARRPVTGWIPAAVSRAAFPLLGIGLGRRGTPADAAVLVANHVSWLDILALNACRNIRFVAKSEVADWAGIGAVARATGTVFIRRDPREAQAQAEALARGLRAGARLVLFAEGTSTDGLGIAPFRPALFAAFTGMDAGFRIQPVSLVWRAPAGQSPRFYGWWGDMDLVPHLLKVLAAPRQGGVEIRFHPPLDPADFQNRKALAAACEAAVRAGLEG